MFNDEVVRKFVVRELAESGIALPGHSQIDLMHCLLSPVSFQCRRQVPRTNGEPDWGSFGSQKTPKRGTARPGAAHKRSMTYPEVRGAVVTSSTPARPRQQKLEDEEVSGS
eukprot:scaffold363_cov216-Skeletonema_marinoi.AAC.2